MQSVRTTEKNKFFCFLQKMA